MVKEIRPTWEDINAYILSLTESKSGKYWFIGGIVVDTRQMGMFGIAQYPIYVFLDGKCVFRSGFRGVYRYNYGSWADKLKALYLEKNKKARLEFESRFADLEE